MNDFSRMVIFDLEATCWKNGQHKSTEMETIEVGAVMVSPDDGGILSEFDCFVRPTKNPVLSEFCRELTSIRQENVDRADNFPVVWEEFLRWVGDVNDICLASWGAYDPGQLKRDCALHGLEYPFGDRHVNLKRRFGEFYDGGKFGMKRALRLCGLELEGTHHRGIDDARNIVKIYRWMLNGRQKIEDGIGNSSAS